MLACHCLRSLWDVRNILVRKIERYSTKKTSHYKREESMIKLSILPNRVGIYI